MIQKEVKNAEEKNGMYNIILLLYSTGNTTQYSVTTYMGKESKKELGICIHITDSLCCTPETNTTL